MLLTRGTLRCAVFILATYFVTLSVPALASGAKASDELKGTIEEVLMIVNDESLKKDADIRRDRIQETVAKRFDYRQMGIRSLKEVWSRISEEEQGRFTRLFKRLLGNAYLSQIESLKEGEIDFADENIKGKYALVKTRVRSKSKTTDVDYKMVHKEEGWMVYDFVVNGVSMVQNYHVQFTKALSKNTFGELLKRMDAI
jgi:phospholipid transport system substrate-binding protein